MTKSQTTPIVAYIRRAETRLKLLFVTHFCLRPVAYIRRAETRLKPYELAGLFPKLLLISAVQRHA